MTKTLPLFLLFAAALTLSGCVGFRGNELPVARFDSFQPPAQEKVKVYSQWYAESIQNKWKTNTSTPNPHIKHRFDRVLAESNCCTLVNDPALADVVVHGTAYSEPNTAAAIAGVISGATFTAIPCWGTSRVDLAVIAKAVDSERSYELRDSSTMVIWLPLILAMPFNENPIKTEAEIDANAYRNLLVRMRQDGLLKVRHDDDIQSTLSAGSLPKPTL